MGKTKLIWLGAIWFGMFAQILWYVSLPVLAISDGSVSVFPAVTKEYPSQRSWFVYEALPGTTIKDKVELINQAKTTMIIRVAVLDGAVTNDGGYTLVGNKEENKDIGTWANLSDETVTLLPGARKLIDLTVHVPSNADVGSHPGGVVIWADKSSTANKKPGGMLSIVTRVAARLYLTVPGDIVRKLDVSNVRHTLAEGVLYFNMGFRNNGNVTLMPEADIKLKGIFGSVGEQKDSQFGMILRGGTIDSRVPWQKKAPKFGRFVADFRVHYGEKDFEGKYVKDEYQDVKYVFWLIPWMTILWSIIAILLLIFIRKFWIWILIKQRLNTKTKEHTVKKGETLSAIAKLYGIDAKKIAKFNLLKWPYDLLAGDILLIPQGKMTKEEQKLNDNTPPPSIRPSMRGADGAGILPLVRGGVGGVGLEAVIAEAGDTVKTVAEFAGVSAKEIIMINKLKWPHKLRVGQELFIPIVSDSEEKLEVTTKSSRPVKISVKSSTSKTTSRLSKKTPTKPTKTNKSISKKSKK